jgi:3-phenylpropionate/trans-cinnamate dioxygenase ferredoxin reductase subunit
VTEPVVIIGGGAAGASTAYSLRQQGYDGDIEIIASEAFPPYERPPLSKEFLRSGPLSKSLDILPIAWYEDNRVRLRLSITATEISLGEHALELSDSSQLNYSKLVLATGGRPRHVELGQSPDRTQYLRTVADAEQLRAKLRAGKRLAIVGAGFIGGEIAATARGLGLEVTLIEALEFPLLRVAGPLIGRMYADIHREHGVRLLTNATIQGTAESRDTIALRLSSGDVVDCDEVIIGVGLQPNTELAAAAGLDCRTGVVVDEYSRTSAPDVFAVGDVAEHFHPLFGEWIRVEHHEHALKHGAATARNLIGDLDPYVDPLWFWSDQYEYNLQAVGRLGLSDTVVTRGSIAQRSFTNFHLRRGRLVGAIGVNSGHDVRRAGRLIAARAIVAVESLADPAIDLRSVSADPSAVDPVKNAAAPSSLQKE